MVFGGIGHGQCQETVHDGMDKKKTSRHKPDMSDERSAPAKRDLLLRGEKHMWSVNNVEVKAKARNWKKHKLGGRCELFPLPVGS